MGPVRMKHKKVIELFDENTGEVVRTICYNPKQFNEFVKGFKAMRYPGYSWRYKDKGRKKGKK
jgi:hypothetical protein